MGLHKYRVVRVSNSCELKFDDAKVKECVRCHSLNTLIPCRPKLDDMPLYDCICNKGENYHQKQWTTEKFEARMKEKEDLENQITIIEEVSDDNETSLGRRFI